VPLLAVSRSGTLVYAAGTGGSGAGELVRVDRRGVATRIDTTWSGPFNSFAISPDGRRMAVGTGTTGGGLSVYIKQLDRGAFSRLSFGGQDRRPAWSPDGRMVAFIRDSLNGGGVYGIATDGSGAERSLARPSRPIQEISWSADGAWLVLRTDNGTAGAGDLVGVRMNGDTAEVELVASRFTEMHPAVSPDGRWLAYISDESGGNEVYVRPFPGPGSKVLVSQGGGAEPIWSRDGRELFYRGSVTDGLRLIAARVETAAEFRVLSRTALFEDADYEGATPHANYDVMPDGQSFIMVKQGRFTEVSYVANWPALLTRAEASGQ
jgi:Tol biopolymer transport system component